MEDNIIKHLGVFQLPKSDQKNERKEIEEIIKNDYHIESEVIIFGYDLRNFQIEKILYNCLLIGLNSKDTSKIFNMKFNGQLDKFGIKNISYVCTDA